MRPDRIPGYRIDRVLGKGGMASVYLAIQESLQRPVALKLLTEPGAEEFSERFINEGRSIASISHAHIVTVHDVGISDGLHYLAMEYVEGGDLKQRIRNGVTEDFALDLVEKIASCLDLAHTRGVIHRDIKPANILFRSDGSPLLTDFGIAKHQRLESSLTMTGTVLGSPHYISPEQAQGLAVDGRADIYSLGIVFYEMLTRKKPFQGNSEVDTIIKHIQEPLPILPGEYARYQAFLNRMVGKTPEERFGNARELVDSVQALRGRRCDDEARKPVTLATLKLSATPGHACPGAQTVSAHTAKVGGPADRQSARTRWTLYALAALVPLAASATWWYAPDRASAVGFEKRTASTAAAPAAPAAPEAPIMTALLPPATHAPAPAVEVSDQIFKQAEAYRDGIGVAPDARKAIERFRLAASQGHAGAQYQLGLMYGQGRGVDENQLQAIAWFERAARADLVEAQYLLCLSYALGRGVTPDQALAYAWCDIARERGSAKASEALASLTKRMNGATIAVARGLVDELTREIRVEPRAAAGSQGTANVDGARAVQQQSGRDSHVPRL